MSHFVPKFVDEVAHFIYRSNDVIILLEVEFYENSFNR